MASPIEVFVAGAFWEFGWVGSANRVAGAGETTRNNAKRGETNRRCFFFGGMGMGSGDPVRRRIRDRAEDIRCSICARRPDVVSAAEIPVESTRRGAISVFARWPPRR
jgi:hypothetical protein